jgi:GTP-binding protein
MNFHNTHFLTSASKLSQCPEGNGIEIAFAGRSNAGKSSLLNTLCEQKKLARVSKTPGRTQLLNFFVVDENPSHHLVDLPGYGYAKVSHSKRDRWQEMMSEYLCERRQLKAAVLVMDVRHTLQPFDLQMIDWALEDTMRLHLVLTKSDKLKYGPAKSTMLGIQQKYSPYPFITCQLFSSLKREGVDELREVLEGIYTAPYEENEEADE